MKEISIRLEGSWKVKDIVVFIMDLVGLLCVFGFGNCQVAGVLIWMFCDKFAPSRLVILCFAH